MGIEPTSPAWEAGALPLSYTRAHIGSVAVHTRPCKGRWSERQDSNLRPLRPERNALAKLSYAPMCLSSRLRRGKGFIGATGPVNDRVEPKDRGLQPTSG